MIHLLSLPIQKLFGFHHRLSSPLIFPSQILFERCSDYPFFKLLNRKLVSPIMGCILTEWHQEWIIRTHESSLQHSKIPSQETFVPPITMKINDHKFLSFGIISCMLYHFLLKSRKLQLETVFFSFTSNF